MLEDCVVAALGAGCETTKGKKQNRLLFEFLVGPGAGMPRAPFSDPFFRVFF